MKDVKISKAGVDAAKQNGLTTNEYVYLSYLSSFSDGSNQRIEKIAELFNISAIRIRQYNAKLRRLNLLENDKYNKCVTSKGKSLASVSLKSDKFYFYVKFPFKGNLGSMNNNLTYCLVSQMIKNSKQTLFVNGVSYKAYTSENDVMLFFANQIVSFLGLSPSTARTILNELVANNYLIINGNYLIDTEFAIIPIAFPVQQLVAIPAQNTKFSVNDILNIVNNQFGKADRERLIELLLNGENQAFNVDKKQSNTTDWFYNYPLLDLPILSRENENGRKNPLHCFLIDATFSKNDKQVFYSFWQNLVKDFNKEDRKNTEYHFNGLAKKGVKSVDGLIDYIVEKYKDENGTDGISEFEF